MASTLQSRHRHTHALAATCLTQSCGGVYLCLSPTGSESGKLLQQRLDELETVAQQLQQQLLQEGSEVGSIKTKNKAAPAAAAGQGPAVTTASLDSAAVGGASSSSSSGSKKKRKKKAGKSSSGVAAAGDAAAGTQAQGTSTSSCSAEPEGSEPAASPATPLPASAGAPQPAEPAAPADTTVPADTTAAAAAATTGGPRGHCCKAFCARSFAAAVGAAEALHTSPEVPVAASTSAAASASAPGSEAAGRDDTQASSEGASQEGDWQVVVPKSKQRAMPSGAPCAGYSPPLPGGGSGTPRGTTPRGHHGASSSGGLHQQVLLSAACMAAGPGSSKQAASAAAAAGRHRRQGSSHSICSTMSMASCDSSSCSAGSSSIGAGSGAGIHKLSASVGAVSSPRKAWAVPQRAEAAVFGSSKTVAAAARQQQQQQLAERPQDVSDTAEGAAAAAAAACVGDGNVGFKAALLKTGNDAASDAGTPTVCAVTAGAAFCAALQQEVQAAWGKGQPGSRSSKRPDPPSRGASDAPCAAQVAAEAAHNLGVDYYAQLSDATAGHADQNDDAAAASSNHAASAGSTGGNEEQPAAADAAVGVHAGVDTDPEHQQQLQRMAAELLQARADLAASQLQLRQQVAAHQQQLAAVLEESAAHEATAVQAAVEAAVAETLQSPLLLQVLSAGVQQAVLRERTGMQVRLLQFGLPPAAVLHILTSQPGPPASAAAGASSRPPSSSTATTGGGKRESETGAAADAWDSERDSGPAGPPGGAAAAATAATPVPNYAPFMAQMLSVLSSNVLAASASGGQGSSAAQQQQQQQLHQQLFLQRLHQQQQEQQAAALALPDLQLDLRSEYHGGGSAFVVPAKQQQENATASGAPAGCSAASASRVAVPSAAEAILNLQSDKALPEAFKDSIPASVAVGGQRRSSSGCSSISAVDDAPVADVTAAAGCFYGTIGCSGSGTSGANSSCSPHSSSGCSSAFGPMGHPAGSPAGGSLWGDVSLVGSPALGTSPLLGPSALPLHSSTHSGNGYGLRTSPLGFASCTATQWGFKQGVFAGVGCKQGGGSAEGPSRSSLDSSRVVDLLPDEL